MRQPIEISYRFESCPPPVVSPLSAFAEAAERMVNGSPLAISTLPFARASRMAGGDFANSGYSVSGGKNGDDSGTTRLRAIECAGQTVLEIGYDSEGRLAQAAYADGKQVQYQWWGRATLRVVLPSGRRIECQFLPNARPMRVSYGHNNFVFEYTDHGSLRECVFPDGQSVKFVYDRERRMLASVFQSARFEYEYGREGRVAKCSHRSPKNSFDMILPANPRWMELDVSCAPGKSGLVIASHAVGSWCLGTTGMFEEMLSPSGCRRCVRRDPDSDSVYIWGLEGQTELMFDEGRNLSSTLGPNGIRTLFWPMPGSADVLAIDPVRVCLYQYDDTGLLRKARTPHGSFALFAYDWRGAIKQIRSDIGWMKFRHDSAGRIYRLACQDGLAAKLAYGEKDIPVKILLKLNGPQGWAQCLAFNEILWQWGALGDLLPLTKNIARVKEST